MENCMCAAARESADLSERFHFKLLSTSRCLTRADADYYTRRADVCSDYGGEGGTHGALKADVSGRWAGYIALAVILTAIFTAAAVAGGCFYLIKKNRALGGTGRFWQK